MAVVKWHPVRRVKGWLPTGEATIHKPNFPTRRRNKPPIRPPVNRGTNLPFSVKGEWDEVGRYRHEKADPGEVERMANGTIP